MSCSPGFSPASNCTLSFAELLPAQWAAMRFLTLFLPSLGLVLALVLFWDHLRRDDRGRRPAAVSANTVGLVFMVMAELCLILYYAIDPGFVRAVSGGFFSSSYAAGLTVLLFFSGALSGCATAMLVGFWVSLLQLHGPRTLGFSQTALAVVLAICSYFLVIATVASISVAAFATPATLSVFVGLAAAMTIATAVAVPVAGETVVARVLHSAAIRTLDESDHSRLKSVRLYYATYAIAQVCCASGQFAETFFTAAINADTEGPTWIWAGVAFPGILFSLAYFFVLFALKRKDKRMLRGGEGGEGGGKTAELSASSQRTMSVG